MTADLYFSFFFRNSLIWKKKNREEVEQKILKEKRIRTSKVELINKVPRLVEERLKTVTVL